MKICFVVTDGFGIRNYLYTDVIKLLQNQRVDISIWHSLDSSVINNIEFLHSCKIEEHAFPKIKENGLIRLLREASTHARLVYNASITSNPTILSNWAPKRNTFNKKLFYWFAEVLGKLLATYESIRMCEFFLEKIIRSTSGYNKSKELLRKIRPDILFFTHQRVPSLAFVVLAAKELKIKTVTSIFSWDNIPKARLVVRPEQYFVWSNYMKSELKFFYKEIKEESIFVVGAPQFDFYRSKDLLMDRKQFSALYNLDPTKIWICFSGDDTTTSPYDHLYLEQVAKALIEFTEITIVFREVPGTDITRYKDVIQNYSNIIHVSPEWSKNDEWSYSFPQFSDMRLLVNISFHCSVVINVGSTMALDFANFNNPALYINYDLIKNDKWSVETVYKFQHFRTMEGLDPVGWINNKEEIKEKVMLALNRPDLLGVDRKKWFDRVVQPNEKLSSERIVEAVINK